jgi:hypothetical protein
MSWIPSGGWCRLIALLMVLMLAGGVASADGDDRIVTISANRDDVTFYARSGVKLIEIPRASRTGSGRTRASALNEWRLHLGSLKEALQSQHELSPDEIDFSRFCARADVGTGATKESCQALGTLAPGKALHFSFHGDSPAFSSANSTIFIVNSPCAIVGSGNTIQECLLSR